MCRLVWQTIFKKSDGVWLKRASNFMDCILTQFYQDLFFFKILELHCCGSFWMMRGQKSYQGFVNINIYLNKIFKWNCWPLMPMEITPAEQCSFIHCYINIGHSRRNSHPKDSWGSSSWMDISSQLLAFINHLTNYRGREAISADRAHKKEQAKNKVSWNT